MIGRWLLSAALVASLAYAQRGGGGDMGDSESGSGIGGGRGGGMSGMGGGMGGMRRLSKLELFEEKLKLNKEQREEVQTAYSATMEKSAPLRDIITKGRQVIVNAILAGKSDDVNKMFGEYATVCAQMTAAEAEFFSKVYAVLKPNQQSRAPAAFELVAGMFAGGGMGAGMGAGMGGRRGGRN